jgi:transposase-like protein
MINPAIPSQLGKLLARNGHASTEQTEATLTSTQAPQKPAAKRYSREEKLRILRLVDACTQRGQVAAILRREGIYYATLHSFMQQRRQGRLDPPAKKATSSAKRQANTLSEENALLQRQNQRLTKKLEQAEILLDLQKKVSQLLGITLLEIPDSPMP